MMAPSFNSLVTFLAEKASRLSHSISSPVHLAKSVAFLTHFSPLESERRAKEQADKDVIWQIFRARRRRSVVNFSPVIHLCSASTRIRIPEGTVQAACMHLSRLFWRFLSDRLWKGTRGKGEGAVAWSQRGTPTSRKLPAILLICSRPYPPYHLWQHHFLAPSCASFAFFSADNRRIEWVFAHELYDPLHCYEYGERGGNRARIFTSGVAALP